MKSSVWAWSDIRLPCDSLWISDSSPWVSGCSCFPPRGTTPSLRLCCSGWSIRQSSDTDLWKRWSPSHLGYGPASPTQQWFKMNKRRAAVQFDISVYSCPQLLVNWSNWLNWSNWMRWSTEAFEWRVSEEVTEMTQWCSSLSSLWSLFCLSARIYVHCTHPTEYRPLTLTPLSGNLTKTTLFLPSET